MLNQSLIRCALFACSLLVASNAFAQLIPPSKVFGDWEVSQIVFRKGLTERGPDGGYAQLIGYRFKLTKDAIDPYYSLHANNGEGPLILESKRALSMRVLFKEEKIARPKDVNATFSGMMEEYPLKDAIGGLVTKSITPYYYKLERMTNVYPGSFQFAAVGNVLLMERGSESIMILRRPPKVREPEHVAYCAKVQSFAEKQICSDRHLWIMHRYIENTAPCALTKPVKRVPDAREQSEAFRSELSMCTKRVDNEYCVPGTLLKHSEFLGSLIPPTQTCVNGEYKEMPR